MAEFEPAIEVAHPDLLSTSCPTIIILQIWIELDKKYQLWWLTARGCHLLQDMYTGIDINYIS